MPRKGGWGPTGFGARLKVLREGAGLSQQDLAARVGCNRFTVAKMEQGIQEPGWPLVLAICSALNVGVEEFVPGPAPSQPAKRPRGRPRKAQAPTQEQPERATTK